MDAYLISSLTSKWSDWQIRHVVINMQWNEAVDAVASLKTERNWTSNVQWVLLRSQIVQLITALFQKCYYFFQKKLKRKFE